MLKSVVTYFFGKTVEDRRNSMGYIFISPWIFGVIVFFLIPMAYSIAYIFYDVTITENGLKYHFVKFDNINKVFFQDPNNLRMVFSSIGSTLMQVLLIVAFSLFIAVILNKPFKGRGIHRAIFSLPIIVSSGVLLMVFKQNLFAQSIQSSPDSTIFQGAALQSTLINLGINQSLTNQLTTIVSQILDLMWKSGVQILLFIAAMQAVPKHLYEVCQVEGSTSWQTFWKVTFPMVSPFLLLNAVYTIIDNFTYYDNPVMITVNTYFNQNYYSSSTTLSFFYFIFILIITGIIGGLISRKVFYIEK